MSESTANACELNFQADWISEQNKSVDANSIPKCNDEPT
jgi:hypothetical protein